MGSAIVTGGGGDLGGAIATRLAYDGFAVAVLDIDMTAARRTTDTIVTAGGAGHAFECDLANHDAIVAAFREIESVLGAMRVLVNNAAVFPSGRFVEVPVTELDHTTAINQRAYFLCAQQAAQAMTGGGGGSIINIASITWHGFWSEMAPYVVTKGAVIALTRALARELGTHEIRVNAVAPGAFPSAAEEAQHPDLAAYQRRILEAQALKRRGTFAELAAVVSFLAGPESSFVTGQTINVDGGWVMS